MQESGRPAAASATTPATTTAATSDIAVVLVRPREEGNVGAAARAMANMGLSRLILVEPAAVLGEIAQRFAVGARHILEAATRVDSLREALAPFPRVVATTSTRDRQLAVPLIGPRELPRHLAAGESKGDGPSEGTEGAEGPGGDGTPAMPVPPRLAMPTALVFGPEVGGLTNQDLAYASLVVAIPCAPVQPTLNLAQAVLILAYEIHQAGLTGEPFRGGMSDAAVALEPPAASAEVDGLFDHVTSVLRRIGFDRDTTFQAVLRDLRALASRAGLASREVAILRGICRRAGHALPPESE